MKRKYKKIICHAVFSRAGRSFVMLWLIAGLVACGSGNIGPGAVNNIPKQVLAINVLSALVAPIFTLNGGPFPESEYSDGDFILRSTTSTDDLAPLGSSHTLNPVAVRVVQGSYDVLYQHESGNGVPQNVDTPVSSTVAINADVVMPVAVTSWMITPVFTQNNGSAFPLNEYDDAVFYLRPTGRGDDVFLGNSHAVTPASVQVMAGDYDVIYALETGGDRVPGNQDAVVANVSINADLPAFAIDVKSVRFQLSATLDGSAFPSSQYQHARFILRSTTTDDSVDLGKSYELPLTRMVVEGAYDIVYQHVQGGQLPVNTDAVIAKNIFIANGGISSITVDIKSVGIIPVFTLDIGDGNGPLAFPMNENNGANFYLRSTKNNNDEMFLGASEVVPVTVRVINSDMAIDAGTGIMGSYDVLYRHETGKVVPQNKNSVVPGESSLTLNSNGSLVVPVSSVNVIGNFTLNGNSFPASAGNSVQFLLRDASNASDEFLFGFGSLNNEAISLIPGTYNVILNYIEGDGVPQNKMHTVKFNVPLDAGTTLGVNITAKSVVADFTLDGVPFPASIYQSARFYLRDTTTNKRIFLGNSFEAGKTVPVLSGRYDVIYYHGFGDEVPQNNGNKVGSIVVP